MAESLIIHFLILLFFGKFNTRIAFSVRPRFFMLAGVSVAFEVRAILASISGRDNVFRGSQLPGYGMFRQHRIHSIFGAL
jgi:hypothetical protein